MSIHRAGDKVPENFLDANVQMSLQPWDGICLWCSKGVAVDERWWEWFFGDVVLRMHLHCLVDWLPRAANDAENAKKIIERMEDKK